MMDLDTAHEVLRAYYGKHDECAARIKELERQRDELAAACSNTVENCTQCHHGAIYGNIPEDGPERECPVCYQSIQALAALDQEVSPATVDESYKFMGEDDIKPGE